MSLDEFALIRRYFSRRPAQPPLRLGIGDDAAVLAQEAGNESVLCCDTLVAGRHFREAAAAADVGYKALAVNLSDLAAMGAEAQVFLLALSLPDAEPRWLEGFAEGLHACATRYGVQLAGGDTTRGPLSVTITVVGAVPAGAALRRDGARAGDLLCVTGTLGDAAAGLALEAQADDGVPDAASRFLLERLRRPAPRLTAGLALRGIASAAIDISDGLLADVGHICTASGVGAEILSASLPTSPALRVQVPDQTARLALQCGGGDDYELAVTVPAARLDEAVRACAAAGVPLTAVGRCTAGDGVPRLLDAEGGELPPVATGYRHF